MANSQVEDGPEFVSAVASVPRHSSTAGVRLEDQSALAKVVVKASLGANAGVQLQGVGLGSSIDRLGALICGTRPNEWLIVGERSSVIIAVADLDTTGHMAVTDVSHGRSLLRLSGEHAADVLAKLCNIDLSDHMMPAGAVVTTTVAEIRCDIIRNDLPHEWSVLLGVDSSYGQYFAEAIADAMQEFE